MNELLILMNYNIAASAFELSYFIARKRIFHKTEELFLQLLKFFMFLYVWNSYLEYKLV